MGARLQIFQLLVVVQKDFYILIGYRRHSALKLGSFGQFQQNIKAIFGAKFEYFSLKETVIRHVFLLCNNNKSTFILFCIPKMTL